MNLTAFLSSVGCVFVGAISMALASGDLSNDLKSGSFWKTQRQDLIGKYFHDEIASWVDKDKKQLRLARPTIKLGQLALGEMIVNWQDGLPQSMTIMVYNKGDNGAIDKEDFNNRLEAAKTALSDLSGAAPKEYKTSRKEALVKVNGCSWGWENGAVSLESSSSREGKEFEAEFIRMKLGPTEASIARSDSSSRARKADVRQNVHKDGKRMVIQGIPMVDQGQKGYCVVATAARVFSYYGMDYVDQHELASIANSSASGGTSPLEMAENLKKIGTRFQIRVKQLESMAENREFKNLLKSYNRVASRLKKEKMPESVDWKDFWGNADGEVLKGARASSPSQINKWLNSVRPYIAAGIPVLWSVELGIVPEPMQISQTRGGHMRMIIGVDEDKHTLIFSDSWGAEHTEKEMPIEDAIAITTGRQVLQPSK